MQPDRNGKHKGKRPISQRDLFCESVFSRVQRYIMIITGPVRKCGGRQTEISPVFCGLYLSSPFPRILPGIGRSWQIRFRRPPAVICSR